MLHCTRSTQLCFTDATKEQALLSDLTLTDLIFYIYAFIPRLHQKPVHDDVYMNNMMYALYVAKILGKTLAVQFKPAL